jgi:hypothetical protein
VPEWERVQRPYKSVVATPLSGFRPPFEKVEARVEEQLLSDIINIIKCLPKHIQTLHTYSS